MRSGVPIIDLRQVTYHGNVELLRTLLATGADPNATTYVGETPLHSAARIGQVEIVKVLLADRRTDPNLQDYEGSTALHTAAHHGHVEVASLLLEAGANPTIKDKYGWTALQKASQACHREVAKVLEANGNRILPRRLGFFF